MNFLAHIYLSFDHDEIAIGNFIADSIRGKKYLHLPENIQKGVLLHRAIDTFTDSHNIPKMSSKRLHAKYGHYSRVIVDIYYDHFLAKNWPDYSNTPLVDFASDFYFLLESHRAILPLRVQQMLPIMKRQDWLFNYGNMEGMASVLSGMNKRTKNRSKMNLAIGDLQEHYEAFESEFTLFFKELTTFSKLKFNDLTA